MKSKLPVYYKDESNAIHAFVSQQLVPNTIAAFYAKTELSLREQTTQSVVHYQKATDPVDLDSETL